MKRTLKRPDGGEEVLEGTAEELAEYERQLREGPKKPQRPGVLRGRELEEQLDGLRKIIDDLHPRPAPWTPLNPLPWQPWQPGPIWVTSCPTCGRVGCGGQCWPTLLPHITCGTVTLGGTDLGLLSPAGVTACRSDSTGS